RDSASGSARALGRTARTLLSAAAAAGAAAAEALVGTAAASAAGAARRPGPASKAMAVAAAAAVASTTTRRAATAARAQVATTAAVAEAAAIAVAASAVLTDREFRRLPLDLDAFGARELRANQRTMHGTFVERGLTLVRIFVHRHTLVGDRGDRHHERRRRIAGIVEIDVRFVNRRRGDNRSRGRILVRDPREHFLVQRSRRIGLLAARGLPAFVHVLGVAGRATGLFDVFFDHRD